MKYFNTALIICLSINTILAVDPNLKYEPATNLCQKCICDDNVDESYFKLDCTVENFEKMIANWPTEYEHATTETRLEAIFSGCSFEKLQQLPPTTNELVFTCRHCGIIEISAGAFIDATRIVSLDLAYNKITSDALNPGIFRGRYMDALYEPIALRILDLSHNEIHSLDDKIFEHTPELESLSLSHNPLNSILDTTTVMAFQSVSKLTLLDLSYTGIEAIPHKFFDKMSLLKELDMRGNKLTSLGESLGVLTNLQTLHIGQNPILKIDDDSFVGLLHLTHLNMSSLNNLTDVSVNAFKPLKSLEVLNATHNENIKCFDLNSLKMLPNLRELDLRHSGLTKLELNDFVADNETNIDKLQKENVFFSALRTLKLEGNPWHCDCSLLRDLIQFNYYNKINYKDEDNEARCNTPYDYAGTLLSELIKQPVCNLDNIKQARIPYHDRPPFLRPKSLLISILSVVGVVLIGLIVGFAIVWLKAKLKKADVGFVSPVRYTTVRNSTISANGV